MKHMKTIAALLLTLALLLSACAACGEGLPYMQQLSQNNSSIDLLLTTESYPEVCISPTPFESMYIDDLQQPLFVHFPCPEGTYATNFNVNSCSFVNMEYGYQYFYNIYGDYDFDTFTDGAGSEEYIIADGSNGMAIYLEPDRGRSHALIAVEEADLSAKLEVLIYDSSILSSSMSEQQIIDNMTSLITQEAERIVSNMSVNLMENYWSQGRYAGLKMLCNTQNSGGLIMTYTLPEDNVIVSLSGNYLQVADLLTGIITYIDLRTDSYVDYKQEEEPEYVKTYMASDGQNYRIYYSWYEDTLIMSAYADRIIVQNAGYDEQHTLYLLLDIRPDVDWTDETAVQRDIEKILSGVRLDFNQTFPDYHGVASYPAAPALSLSPTTGDTPVLGDFAQGNAEVPAPADGGADVWICASCGSENSGGKFCPNCGAARPQQLVCSNCGYVVPEGQSPNFCPECGNPF